MEPTGTILVVADELDSPGLIEKVLAEQSYLVRRVKSADEALAAIQVQHPELVLIDVRNPYTDGFALCQKVKADETLAETPLILLTPSTDAKHWVEGFALGAADFVSKPFQRDELLARVATHLELARLHQRLGAQMSKSTAALRALVWKLQRETSAVNTHAERVLKESEERFRNMADNAPMLVWVSGTDRKCTFFNKGWLQFTGRTMEQELGDGWAEGVHPEDLDHTVIAYNEAFDAQRSFQLEYRLRRVDGVYRWILDNGVPRFEAGGLFVGYVGSCVDITDSKQAYEGNLDKQRVKSLRVLTGGIAHDFKNLMSSILTTAELAEAEVGEGSSPVDEIRTIRDLAQRAVEIVRELMIYAGQDKGTFELVDLSQLVEEMLSLLRSMIGKNVVLEADLPANLPPVWGNPTHLRQIVMNLVINASDAINGSGGKIKISTSRARRTYSSQSGTAILSGGECVRLEVSDTGCGMTPEQKAKMFDPYFTTKRTGHGLGLAVVDAIVQSHGGVIQAASAPGRGTTFEVLLPVVHHRERKAPQTMHARS